VPYGLAAVVISIALGPIYVLLTVVGTLLAFALVIWWRFPAWTPAATLIQSAVCIYILLYIRTRR
jgi:hypothetical protein